MASTLARIAAHPLVLTWPATLLAVLLKASHSVLPDETHFNRDHQNLHMIAKQTPAARKLSVSNRPDGHKTVTPYLIVHGVAELLTFLAKAFDAKEIMRLK